MEFLFSAESWAALLTLTLLEIVLGIDNIVFISILAGKLPEHQRQRARTLGLALAPAQGAVSHKDGDESQELADSLASFFGPRSAPATTVISAAMSRAIILPKADLTGRTSYRYTQ